MGSFSPRERGEFPSPSTPPGNQGLFPARAGVIPKPSSSHSAEATFPRASGGNSFRPNFSTVQVIFSPRERG